LRYHHRRYFLQDKAEDWVLLRGFVVQHLAPLIKSTTKEVRNSRHVATRLIDDRSSGYTDPTYVATTRSAD
jgi:hypothetical protein